MKNQDRSKSQLMSEIAELRKELAEVRKGYELLKTITHQLRESNQKLQGFVYLTSHELHAPLISLLRAIDILTERTGPALPPEEAVYLRSAKASAESMLSSMRKFINASEFSGTRDSIVLTKEYE